MFCQYCGNELGDDARFCQRCGKKIELSEETVVDANEGMYAEEALFDRDVLILYLNQMRTLEFSKLQLSCKLNDLDNQISNLGHSRNVSTPYKDSVDIEAIGGGLFLGVLLTAGGSFFYSFIPWGIFSLARILGILLIIGTIVIGIISAYNKSIDNDSRQAKYYHDLAEDDERVAKELKEKDRLLNQRPEYVKRLEEAKALLVKSYQINVIPKQFRNLYAVYYLYDYLSTSHSTLESAMMHCDLNEIKAKLDIVIAQQQIIILQQAQQMAQNDRMIEQNNEMIEHAIATEKNAKYAAQYAEIAAVNSEVTAFTNTVMAAVMLDSR